MEEKQNLRKLSVSFETIHCILDGTKTKQNKNLTSLSESQSPPHNGNGSSGSCAMATISRVFRRSPTCLVVVDGSWETRSSVPSSTTRKMVPTAKDRAAVFQEWEVVVLPLLGMLLWRSTWQSSVVMVDSFVVGTVVSIVCILWTNFICVACRLLQIIG